VVLPRESGDWTSPACHHRLSPFSDFAEPSAHYLPDKVCHSIEQRRAAAGRSLSFCIGCGFGQRRVKA
jgi:hypothetical protein